MMKIISILLFTICFGLSAKDKNDSPELQSNSAYAGYSALVPGLGQIKKDRLYAGIFIFTVFSASAWNVKQNLDNVDRKKSIYQQSILIAQALTLNETNFFTALFFPTVVSNQYFGEYSNSGIKANNAISYMGLIYFAQILHAYFCSPGATFQKDSESKVFETSNFQFSFSPSRNQFGQQSMNLDINYTWRF